MGYLLIDTRIADGRLQEYETCSCVHCQKIMKIIRGQTSGYYCQPCNGPVCEACAALGMCEPSKRRYQAFMSKVDAAIRRQEFWRRLQHM